MFNVSELKKFLSNRRQHVSGRKSELIRRIWGAYHLKIPDNMTLADRDGREKEKCDLDRFKVSPSVVCPRPELLASWTSDYELIPAVTEKDIYNYIVLKKHSKRQLKSKGFYDDGHVHTVEVTNVFRTFFF